MNAILQPALIQTEPDEPLNTIIQTALEKLKSLEMDISLYSENQIKGYDDAETIFLLTIENYIKEITSRYSSYFRMQNMPKQGLNTQRDIIQFIISFHRRKMKASQPYKDYPKQFRLLAAVGSHILIEHGRWEEALKLSIWLDSVENNKSKDEIKNHLIEQVWKNIFEFDQAI